MYDYDTSSVEGRRALIENCNRENEYEGIMSHTKPEMIDLYNQYIAGTISLNEIVQIVLNKD